MFSSIKNIFKKQEDAILFLDIGGSSVKAAVIKQEKESDKISILSYYREYFDEEIFNESSINYENLRLNVLRAKFFAEKKVKFKISKMVVGLAEEFVKSLTLSIKHKRSDPQEKINISELRNILLKVRWQIKEKTKETEQSINIIEAAIQEVLIDGWRVTSPMGFNGKEISLNLYYSYLNSQSANIFNQLIQSFGLKSIAIFSKSYSVISSEIFKNGPNLSAIFINISTYRTDLFLVQKGKILEVKSFGIGSAAFTKKIAQEFGIGFFEAENIKLKYCQNNVSDRINNKIKEIIEKELSLWLNGVLFAIKDFSSAELLPSFIMLYGGGANMPDLTNFLSKVSWTNKFNFESRPEIKILNPDFENINDLTGLVDKGPAGASFFSLIWRLSEFNKPKENLDNIFKKI